ncbi:hypothetical protein ACSTS3_06875 [Aquimarina muelleri]|uniref:hypothetical protein n=1 Tax=Aquimarina muelleri TaxID=279356 RepID=UPI003F684032
MKYCILFIFCSISIQAQTYEGTIGNYQIFLELDIDHNEDEATAFYFYKSHLKNIPLEGSFNNNELLLFEKFSDIKKEKELFTLSVNKDIVTGTWTNNGHTLQVDLHKTTKKLDTYKLMNLHYVRDSITTYDTKELVWFTEKHSKKILFRLGNGFTKSEREFINPKLDTIHTSYAMIGLDCSWADINIEIELISNQYLSFSEYSSIYCGGAHPNYNTTGYNFDYKNKRQLDRITDIYPNVDHFQELKRKYKNDTDLDSECDYFTDREAYWKYYSWVLTKNGITITPSYPHAMTPCEMGFLLPYNKLLETNVSYKSNVKLQTDDISFYKNNDSYFIKDIDINNDTILDKIVSSKPYQGDKLLLFINDNNTYRLGLKTSNFSEDGGNQITDIKKDKKGFVIITSFLDRGFLQSHHYVSLIDNKWMLTHTIYKTQSSNKEDAFIYVCNVKQNIDLSAPELINALKDIPDEVKRETVCVKEKI